MVLGIVIPVILVFTKASAPIILMFGPNDIPVILLLYANASDPISVTEDLNDIFPEIAPGKEAIILVLSLLYIIPL